MVDTTVDLENDLCICGRFAWRVHCPHCGSYHNYSYTKRDSVTRQDNTVVHLCVHRCRRCAAVFNDDQWKLHCAAPHIVLTTRSGRKPTDAATSKPLHYESLDEAPDGLRQMVEEIRRKRGIKE